MGGRVPKIWIPPQVLAGGWGGGGESRFCDKLRPEHAKNLNSPTTGGGARGGGQGWGQGWGGGLFSQPTHLWSEASDINTAEHRFCIQRFFLAQHVFRYCAKPHRAPKWFAELFVVRRTFGPFGLHLRFVLLQPNALKAAVRV